MVFNLFLFILFLIFFYCPWSCFELHTGMWSAGLKRESLLFLFRLTILKAVYKLKKNVSFMFFCYQWGCWIDGCWCDPWSHWWIHRSCSVIAALFFLMLLPPPPPSFICLRFPAASSSSSTLIIWQPTGACRFKIGFWSALIKGETRWSITSPTLLYWQHRQNPICWTTWALVKHFAPWLFASSSLPEPSG